MTTTQVKPVQSNPNFNQRSHRIKRWPHKNHAATTHSAIGVVLVLVARSDAYKRQREEQHSPLVASMDNGSYTDGQEPTQKRDSEIAKGATPFSVVKVKRSIMIWSMLVQCKGVEDQAAIKQTVESLNRLGYPELMVRSDHVPAMLAIKKLKERSGVRVIAQACMVENVIKKVKEKVRTLVTATRELHGVVMDPGRVALAWCLRFAGEIKGADGLTAFQRAFQRTSHPRAMLSAWREKILYLEASKKKIRITDKFLDAIFFGHQRRF